MAHVKTKIFSARNDAGAKRNFTTKIMVSTSGEFYCVIPDYIYDILSQQTNENFHVIGKGDVIKAFSTDMDFLISCVWSALMDYLEPEIIEEIVIQYNIESHVSFAETDDGEIKPSAVYENAHWSNRDNLYGGHHSAKPSNGGYSLTIGAKAMIKKTYKYGESEKIEYENYYGNGDHLDYCCPASTLNSWCSFSLPKNPKEIPYTDDAAIFFHNLMLGMAKLSKKIQHFTSDKDKLLNVINNNLKLLK